MPRVASPRCQTVTRRYNCCLLSEAQLFNSSLVTPFPHLSLDSAKKYDVDGNLFEIITSDETRYFLQAATAEERKEWINAVQAVSKSGK